MMLLKVEWKFLRELFKKRFIFFMVIVIIKDYFGNDFVRIKKIFEWLFCMKKL